MTLESAKRLKDESTLNYCGLSINKNVLLVQYEDSADLIKIADMNDDATKLSA